MVGNNAIVPALPSHSSHHTQPLDVAEFGPMKGAKESMVSVYVNNPATTRSRCTIFSACELIASAYSAERTSYSIKSGF